MSQAAPLPHWDMTVVYPGLDSPEFAADFSAVTGRIAALAELFAQHAIAGPGQALDDASVAAFETITAEYDRVLAAVRTLTAYITSFVSTDSRNSLAQSRMSELQAHLADLTQLGTRWIAWVGGLDADELIERSAWAREHAFVVRRAREQAAHLMLPAEESLAAELNLSSGTGWSKLHGTLTSQLMVEVEQDGQVRSLPMSVVRNLAFDPDRATRRRAHEAELATWQSVSIPLAAALNGIKGQVTTLARRRGWASPLQETLFQNNIDQQTLDAMMTAAREAFPDFRRYLKAKARLLGVERLAWYDLFAPLGGDTQTWEYDRARTFIVEQFGTYSPRLSEFAARAFAENWVDAEPRPGKRDGAFCMLLRGDESRVFANYKPAYGGMRTLAHELGHAYHNLNLADRTMLGRSTPMTMAETASIFCETVIQQAALGQTSPGQQVAILEASLVSACQQVVDISSRFLFEQRVFDQRQTRDLTIDELSAIMLEAQRETYGDGLDEATLHPFMWAVKQHYYSAGLSFYNYPYMFGLLFGLGLYARYQESPAGFHAGYDDLLASTGLADAATLAARFGIDIRTPDFWRSSLDIIRRDIDRFVAASADQ
jgi:pepF/M3 family oligoendopeptidase